LSKRQELLVSAGKMTPEDVDLEKDKFSKKVHEGKYK
jgi:hypothetical protein